MSRLMAAHGRTVGPAAFTVTGQSGVWTVLASTDELVAGPIHAREVLFPLAPGLLVPAWSLVVFTSGDEDWYAVVDAETGDLLWRKNIRNYVSTHDARFRVYVQADGVTPADSPAPQSPSPAVSGAGTQFAEILPSLVSMHTAMDATASPDGWINDCPGGICTANETQTLGNNVLACLDREACRPTPAIPAPTACSTATAGRLAIRTPTPATATSSARRRVTSRPTTCPPRKAGPPVPKPARPRPASASLRRSSGAAR